MHNCCMSGVKKLEHNRAVKYYTELLQCLHLPASKLAIVDDLVALLAVMDEEVDDGEPESDKESHYELVPLVRHHPK